VRYSLTRAADLVSSCDGRACVRSVATAQRVRPGPVLVPARRCWQGCRLVYWRSARILKVRYSFGHRLSVAIGWNRWVKQFRPDVQHAHTIWDTSRPGSGPLSPPKLTQGDPAVPDFGHVADLVAVEVHHVRRSPPPRSSRSPPPARPIRCASRGRIRTPQRCSVSRRRRTTAPRRCRQAAV
jgi:hypothetical protein